MADPASRPPPQCRRRPSRTPRANSPSSCANLSPRAIGIGLELITIRHRAHHACQILDVHMMADPRIRQHYLEIPERFLPPSQKLIALLVTLKFQLGIHPEGVDVAETVHLH